MRADKRYTIAAQETVYGGYRMRSKLEVEWAKALDADGREWRYEPRRIALPSGSYLPDFLVALNPTGTSKFWLEVKGPEPTERELHLCAELSAATGIPVQLAHGRPGECVMLKWLDGIFVRKMVS